MDFQTQNKQVATAFTTLLLSKTSDEYWQIMEGLTLKTKQDATNMGLETNKK